MRKVSIVGGFLMLLGLAVIGRKTYLVGLIAPEQIERSWLDSAIILTGGILMTAGIILLNVAKKGQQGAAR